MIKKIKKLSYLHRIDYCLNPTAKRLCEIISTKASNLCVSADLSDTDALLTLADQIGPEICLLKTHVDILTNFDMHFITKLKDLAEKHAFLIFEDRKFADIGNTVKQQYKGGLFRIADWADITNAHTVPGPGIIQGLRTVGLSRQRGLLLLAQMSTQGSLAQGAYTQASLAMANDNLDFVIGFIAQKQLTDNPGLLHLTPGVKFLHSSGDGLGQQYISPEQAIIENGTDIIIVGRGIYQAKDPQAEAMRYRKSSWKAYNTCC
ncbi:MAG: orotidine-5'-phosphate decarboxylase [Rickettsiella sp.]|nr:orotidine-5'-phosphate decarboxylase [Rickettsiella sp.]